MAISEQPRLPPQVAVVTVSYGSADVLSGFLASIPDSSVKELMVVVADNKPNDGGDITSLVHEASGLYLPLAENRGYGGGMNAAIRALPASVEWVLISNPDVELGHHTLDVLVKAGSLSPQIAAVGPAILTNGAIYPSARSVPSLRTGVGHALFANLWLGNPWTKAYRRDSILAPVRRDAGWLSGACLLVRKSAFDEIGGFDEGFFMYFEDVDLGYRFSKRGYRNVYEPSALVVHTGAHSTHQDSARMISAHHDSARRFLSKKYSGPFLWPLRAVLTGALSARSAILQRRIRSR